MKPTAHHLLHDYLQAIRALIKQGYEVEYDGERVESVNLLCHEMYLGERCWIAFRPAEFENAEEVRGCFNSDRFRIVKPIGKLSDVLEGKL